jgi:hypothetical protein
MPFGMTESVMRHLVIDVTHALTMPSWRRQHYPLDATIPLCRMASRIADNDIASFAS